ncbi:MAG: MBL fold metallo-hydrolase [Candidatus Verstraetearchaeota archaeon]|nr:MBL fold metallo-hydrolase [Candidatus Verstraetearchaeota archaeon]
MKVNLLAFDSMGARSMCTLVETADLRVLIDPGVALAPNRFGLPPHPVEVERMNAMAKRITEAAMEADVLVVSHYHYDHHDPGDLIPLEIYKNKTVLVKDPNNDINRSQGDFRAPLFLGMVKSRAGRVEAADGKSFTFGRTRISFSGAVFHGQNSALGYVIETMVESEGVKFIHTSDVEGPVHESQAAFVFREKPEIVAVDGPMTYMLGYRISKEEVDAAISNLRRMLSSGVEVLIVDHHMLRDLKFKEYIERIKEGADGVRVLTAAEYMGMPNELLEAKRKDLYKN